jgi:hypothetical protein
MHQTLIFSTPRLRRQTCRWAFANDLVSETNNTGTGNECPLHPFTRERFNVTRGIADEKGSASCDGIGAATEWHGSVPFGG